MPRKKNPTSVFSTRAPLVLAEEVHGLEQEVLNKIKEKHPKLHLGAVRTAALILTYKRILSDDEEDTTVITQLCQQASG